MVCYCAKNSKASQPLMQLRLGRDLGPAKTSLLHPGRCLHLYTKRVEGRMVEEEEKDGAFH